MCERKFSIALSVALSKVLRKLSLLLVSAIDKLMRESRGDEPKRKGSNKRAAVSTDVDRPSKRR